uniref:Uncharacterized protein n=1 Tax=Rubinisphaera brasiliensis (strain ATCC 49424 / DSM 5305 / JCM 21570 / IAM 15109 / NBRC 103401 / IFAM 1448) TaxID=756272 RepID=F0SLQ0_RUBBR|nr:hypothetical protein Plabr_1175 [Rubinisphaera brasiliensis DSM 5305]
MQGQNLKELVESLGPEKFYRKACDLLNEKTLTADDFSYYELAEACGVLPRLRSVRESMTGEQSAAALLRESNPGVSTHLFQVMTGELIGRKVIDGYENSDGFIGDELVTVLPSSLRGQKLAGFRALAGPTEVAEGHPYEESTFEEKYVTTAEAKQGRILSIQEELIAFDQSRSDSPTPRYLRRFLFDQAHRSLHESFSHAFSKTHPVAIQFH